MTRQHHSMLFKLFGPYALVALTLIIALAGKQAQAVSSVLLGYCSDSGSQCEKKWEIDADPSWDQEMASVGKNLFSGRSETVVCKSFSSATEYKIKVCSCRLCHSCPASLCNDVDQGQCTHSPIGAFRSICARDVK